MRKTYVASRMIQYYSLTDTCNFKKHAGKTWQEVIDTDIYYIEWLFNNVKEFNLDKEAKECYRLRMLGIENDTSKK